MNIITIIGITIILLYSITNIFSFYGIGYDVYGVYVLFYLFILISANILPTDIPEV